MKTLLPIAALICMLSHVHADQPDSESWTLLQGNFHSGSDPLTPMTSAGYRVTRSSLGDLAGPLTQGGEFQLLPGYYLGREDLQIISLLPVDDAVEVDPVANFEIDFNRPVLAGPGNVVIHLASDSTVVETLPAAALSIQGNSVSIDPLLMLDLGASFFVEIEANAFHDEAEHYFHGFNDASTWSFSTIEWFTPVSAGLHDLGEGCLDWGDYDADGDLDLLVIGIDNFPNFRHSKVYNNEAGVFTDMAADLEGLYYADAEWGDYDNDGDLDIAMSGYNGWNEPTTRIYRNDEGSFVDIDAGLIDLYLSCVSWGDLDNDGDLDLFLSGQVTYNTATSRVYRNDAGVFVDLNLNLEALTDGAAEWADYDLDGDADLLYSGHINYVHSTTRLYRNDNGILTDSGIEISDGPCRGSLDWGDYDNDGDPDILMTGIDHLFNRISTVLRNDGGSFTDINSGTQDPYESDACWGDFDNDGDLDILMTGINESYATRTYVYRNDNGLFSAVNTGLIGLQQGSIAWGDCDNDGDLDIAICGTSEYGGVRSTEIYLNNIPVANHLPAPPTVLSWAMNGQQISFSWDSAFDMETPANGLSYNLMLGLPADPGQILSGMSDPQTGYRRVTEPGNAGQGLSWELSTLDQGALPILLAQQLLTLQAGVQAVDASFAGSAFATSTLDLTGLVEYLSLENQPVMGPDNLLLWELRHMSDLTDHQLQIAPTAEFVSPLMDETIPFSLPALDRVFMAGIALQDLAEFGLLQDDSTYYWRVQPIYTDTLTTTLFSAQPGVFVLDLSNTAPSAPADGFNPSGDAAVSSLTPRISWGNGHDPDDHPGNLHYVIEVDTSNVFTAPELTSTTGDGITYADVSPDLLSGYRYFYRVKTVDDGAAASDWSETQSFLTIMPPQNVSASSDGESIHLSWEAQPLNIREQLVYTVYASGDPFAAFPADWQVVAAQLSDPGWSSFMSQEIEFYRVTVGSTGAFAGPENSREHSR